MTVCSKTFAICFAGLITGLLYAAAPVVDDSENFAIVEQQQTNERPLAHDRSPRNIHAADLDYDDEVPLAHDSSPARSNSSNVSLLNKLQSLQQEVQELRGQLELQNHELKVLRDQQLTFYKDLDARMHQAPKTQEQIAPKPVISAAPKASNSIATADKPLPRSTAIHTNNPADEQIRYLAAYDLIKNKRFDEAYSAMQSFANDYPNGGFTANAYYWLGELSMTKKDYPEAIKQFETVLNQFPNSSKSAPSLLKISYALSSSGQKQEAIARLKQVIKQYPDTTTAQLAETKLKSLGH